MVRELRVIGLEPGGTHVVCADTESGERFRLPADDKLRAAARGDIARFGQIEIETESQLRPKDIQARIRAGATIEQVAAEAGVSMKKVERFAHPVLLERALAAQKAQGGHPVRENGPALQTLEEIVSLAFRARGHNLEDADWDAWRGEDGHWVAQLQWQAGRTTNAAHWHFQYDAHGGTVVALDAAATDLLDPDFGRPLRGLAPVTEIARDDEFDSFDAFDDPDDFDEAEAGTDAAPAAEPTDDQPLADEPSEPAAETSAPEPLPKVAPQHQSGRDKKGRPALPSWDDVLLGIRSSGRG